MTEAILEVFRVKTIHVDADVAKKRDELHAQGKCTSCERPMEGKRSTLGQCSACYQTSRNYRLRGLVTTEELVKSGKQLPPSKGGRKPINKFTKQLSERRQ